MRRLKHNFKKGMAFVLSLAMVAGLVPAMSGGANTVQAATGSGTEPSVTAYATKAQLMTAFTPDANGTATTKGKLVFGKKSDGTTAQEWYILGKDEGVSGDNTIIFAANPIATGQKFNSDISNKNDENLWSDCVYSEATITEVYANHYGASELRDTLQGMATNTSYFTSAEQGLMNATTVTTKDTKNSSVTYTTTDKLYALQGDFDNNQYLWAGTDDSTVLAMSSYWRNGEWFWLRSPFDYDDIDALRAYPGIYVDSSFVRIGFAVQPASNLDLSSVLFASAATAASSDTKSEKITDGTAMTLRLDGTYKNIGTVTYNITTGDIKAVKGSTSQTVALVVQGNDGTNDWYYSKKIDTSETINISAIEAESYTPASIDLSACKIWLEITEDNVSYAVNAEKEIEKINTTYVTKEQLMNSFKPYSNGTAVNYGKLVFGKKSDGTTAQEWYILGKDEGVSGDNTIIFAANPIATGQKFNSDISNKNDENLWSDCVYSEATITEVYANHYGASELRDTLQGMATNTSYFTSAEQGLMNATTVTTKDTKNSSVTYTTTDKLYALQGDYDNDQYLWAGTDDSTVLAMSSYLRNGEWFWLRSPYGGSGDFALCADRGYYVILGRVDIDSGSPVQPASNLDLSSVLFASAATAASSDTKSEKITDSAAMTLRLDGTGKDIGTVTYNTTTGDIKVVKGTTSQTVALVVQGNDGTNDWYYSKQITGTETINASDIKSALSLTSDIDLSACKIWLETTDSTSNLTYAVNATDIISITSVAITDIDIPVSNTALDTEASCTTEGVKSTTPQITWTPSDTTAGYNTRYTASITLTAATGYEFADNVTATVSGNTATSVTKNAADDTLTVTKEFTTDKRKIESVAAPTVPENNTFTAYYGYDGYDTTPISGTNTELGKTATVTFEGTTSPTTEDMAVTWTIESDGGVYDKTPEAENIFRWTIPESALTNYNAANCQGYDTSTGNITGTITVKNKAATPVAITGTDSSIVYTGATVDVSQYFSIDNNAGAATYTLVTGTNGGTGEGTLSDTTLTVTHTGTFKIKVSTAANGIFAAGEKTVTLTVDNGTILYTATDYSTTYDGQPHSISVSVTNPEGTDVTYSTDGVTYGSDNPSFSNEGTHTVYYRITKDNYTTVEASKTVTINKKPVTITAQEQDIVWGNDINQSLYTVSEDGLITGDSIKEITLTPSTTARTENGTISVSGVKIENAAGADVTANYDITMVNGNLKITHDAALAPERIEASKTKTTYTAGDTLNVDDLAVTAYYADGYSESVQDYTTNVSAIDMSANGDKILTVSYTKNGVTKTKDITIKVNAALASYKIISGADSEWKQNTDETITIIGNGEFSKFESVKVDGSIIDAKNYTAKEGSTIIILKADYLKTLSVGTHSFEIVWADGSAVTSFKVSKNTSDNEGSKDNNGNKNNSNDNPNSNLAAVPDDKKTNGSDSGNNADDSIQITAPQTGDNSHPMLWVTLLAASLAGLLALLSVRRKKDEE
nr:bacterial Ig-like domain-containing protein [uncultured Agathobacter sp.]